MSGDPRECRQQAQECLRLAQEATSDQARQDFTALAHTWGQLANMFESDNALLNGFSATGSERRSAQTATARQASGGVAPQAR